jgi:threonine/homoserine/homoserine lactone efflux protein
MNPIVPLIASAFILGATSGLSPGPLLTLVVTESLQRDFRSGTAVAIAPLITDAPIVLLMTVLASALSSMQYVIGGLYLAGAGYLAYLSVDIFRFKGMELMAASSVGASLRKGVIVNLLNPAPYIFWLTVGAPLLVEAREISWMAVVAFLCIFYGLLVGTKLLLALLIGKNRHALKGGYYKAAMRIMGIFLLVFAAVFIRNGVENLFGV